MPAAPSNTPNLQRIVLGIILGLHVALAIHFSLVTPVWEAYDETGHFYYARYLAVNNRLPILTQAKAVEFDESHQPPLYYWLASLPIRLVDVSDDAQPRFALPPVRVVPPKQDAWPYTGTMLAIRLARLVTVAISAAGPLLAWLTSRELMPGRPRVALLSAALFAVWPQYNFQSGTVTNDILLCVCASAVFWATARLISRPARSMPLNAGLVACAGLAASLTKDNGLTIFLFALGVIVVTAAQRWRKYPSHAAAAVGVTCVMIAVIFPLGAVTSEGRTLRQWDRVPGAGALLDLIESTFRWGTPNAANNPDLGSGERPELSIPSVPDPTTVFRAVPATFSLDSFRFAFGFYGWGTVALPEAWYIVAALVLGFTLPGLVLAVRRRPERRAILLSVAVIVAVFAAPIARQSDSPVNIGRFLVPALGATSFIFALGACSLGSVFSSITGVAVLACVSLISLVSPLTVIGPRYRTPVILDDAMVNAQLQVPLRVNYGDQFELLGYSHLVRQTKQGGWAPFRLFWRALKPMTVDWTEQLEMFSDRGISYKVRRIETPGNSYYPTGDWEVGKTFAEDYNVFVAENAPAPAVAGLKIKWLDPVTGHVLESTCSGRPCDPLIGGLPVALGTALQNSLGKSPVKYRLGDQIELLDVGISIGANGRSIEITPTWRARVDVKMDYTVFVHIVDSANRLVAQIDSPPLDGAYRTVFWSASEIVVDRLEVPLPDGLDGRKVTIRIGMYSTETGGRLAAADTRGTPLPDGVITLGTIEVR